jgi:hypothetical protein
MNMKFHIKLPFMKNSSRAKAAGAAHRIRLGKDPYFDWAIILAVSFMMAVLCVSFALALWVSVTSAPENSAAYSSSGSASTARPSLNSAGLEQVVNIQLAKASAESQYGQSYVGPSDPSL